MKKIASCLLLTTFIYLACNNNTATTEESKVNAAATHALSDSSKLNGDWQLNYMAGMAVPFDSLFSARIPHINFDLATKRFAGNTGCNNFSGELDLSGNTISFVKPMIMTKMFCQGNAEQFFTQNLQKVNSWAISNDTTLHFKAATEEVMRFSKK